MRSLSSLAIDGSTASRIESIAYPASQMSQAGMSIAVSGTDRLMGVVWIETSQEISNTFPVTLYTPTQWDYLQGSSVIVNGNGEFSLPTTGFAAQWIRVVYEPSLPSTGSIKATLGAFGSSSSGGIAVNYISQTIINNNGGGGVSTFDAPVHGDIVAGDFVARDGNAVTRASGIDATKMPAVGVVTQVKPDGTVTVQSHGPVTGLFTADNSKIVFVGADGRPTSNIAPLTCVQAIGTWANSSTFVLSVGPSMVVKTAA